MHTHTQAHIFQHKQLRSEEHTSELQSHLNLVCRLLLEKKNETTITIFCITKTLRHQGTNTRTHTHDRPTHSRSHTHAPTTIYTQHHLFPFFFFNDTATTEIYPLSLHNSLPI